jgi:MATE family multidrug resistance protein
LVIALPMIASSSSQTVAVVINRQFLTKYSEEALAAVLPAGMLAWTLVSIVYGTCQYANTFVAQFDGAKEPDRVAASVWQAAYLSVIGGAVLMLAGFLAEPIFRLVGHDPSVIPHEVEFFRVLAFGSIPPILAVSLSCFFSGRGRTAVLMWVNLAAALTNIVFDYFLIFGNGPFPELGIRGAAIATVLGSVVAVLLYAMLFFRRSMREQYGTWRNRGLDLELCRRFVKFGLPAGLHLFADVASFAAFMLLVGRLGKSELAATNLTFNLNAMAFIPMLGLGIAVSTLVGNRIGERRPELAVRTTWTAFALGGCYMLAFASAYLLMPDLILGLYDGGRIAEMRGQVIVLLRFVAIYSFFDAMGIVFGSAVRGAGDTRFALFWSLGSSWTLMVIPTAAMLYFDGGGLIGSWSACTVYAVVLGLGFMARFVAGHWKSMSVIGK